MGSAPSFLMLSQEEDRKRSRNGARENKYGYGIKTFITTTGWPSGGNQ